MDEEIKTYCFDFDGTIADTIPLIIKTLDSLLKKSGEEEISDTFLRKIRDEGVEEVFREIKVPLYKLFFLYIKIKKEMNSGVVDVAVNPEIKEVLRELKSRGIVLGILTSNSEKNVLDFLKRNDLNFFDFVITSGVLGKERSIKKLKRKGGIFVYIGDETRDIKAGKRARVKTVAVPWGLSSKRALLKSRPDVLIEKPGDILEISF